ncbi:MAG: hypothetical protein M3150_07335, partial [Pseudomonadota bacterium]|nr:hypothetical protein [Pseudomonadota bacterium]
AGPPTKEISMKSGNSKSLPAKSEAASKGGKASTQDSAAKGERASASKSGGAGSKRSSQGGEKKSTGSKSSK